MRRLSPRKVTEQDILDIMWAYKEGASLAILSLKYPLTPRAMWALLKRRGFICRPKGFNLTRFYDINENFFDNINSQKKAYWLGFLMADGCITDENMILCNLAFKDKGHLEKFKTDIESKHPIKEYYVHNKVWKQTSHMASMHIGSKKLCAGLKKHGCIPRKTTRVHIPHIMPKLLHHFIRGYFDGDGCICGVEKKPWVSMIGNIEFIQECQDILIQNCGVSKTKLKKRHKEGDLNVISLAYCGRGNAIKIRNYLYKNAIIYLERKKERFDLLEYYSPGCILNGAKALKTIKPQTI